ncbi:MAG: UDP-N-acetylmuramate dehydrogenase [Amylibacter sp.]|jgi:UDP-N-acetylmuramate dehydrogenase|nr:UDP-N-acetylmuramate dehydrogenase [Amylibacter sp.]
MTEVFIPKVRGTIVTNRLMSDLSWLKVGGKVDYLFQPADLVDLSDFLKNISKKIPIFMIGVCSNLIVRDGGIRGVVIKLGRGFNGIELLENNRISVGAAALDAHVAKKAAIEGIDLTFLRTIPGTIGGAVKMNAGCYGKYISDVFESANVITREGKQIILTKKDMHFDYRSSVIPKGSIITNVILKSNQAPSEDLMNKMQSALSKRSESQPVNELSCGSTFRNPSGFSSTGQIDDVHDLKAWKVIDNAGMRGATIGGAKMSDKHSNFMINIGDATAADLENLGEEVIKKVYADSGIKLEWEIMRVGEP